MPVAQCTFSNGRPYNEAAQLRFIRGLRGLKGFQGCMRAARLDQKIALQIGSRQVGQEKRPSAWCAQPSAWRARARKDDRLGGGSNSRHELAVPAASPPVGAPTIATVDAAIATTLNRL